MQDWGRHSQRLQMTVLCFADTADPASSEGASFLALLGQLQLALPGSCLLAATAHPPSATRPWPNLDWVTLPNGARRATTLGLLRAYARWYQPTVSLFFGAQARTLASSCFGEFGVRLLGSGLDVTSLAGDPWQLPDDLLPVLPVSLVVAEDFNRDEAAELLATRKRAPELRLHCAGEIGTATLGHVRWAAEQHPGKPRVFVRLKQGLLRGSSGAVDLLRLLQEDGRFEVIVRGEKEFGSVVSHLLSTTLRVAGELR